MTNQRPPLPPVRLAFVIDDKVVDVLHTDERLAAIFLSEPLIVDISDRVEQEGDLPLVGGTYNRETGEFTPVALEDLSASQE